MAILSFERWKLLNETASFEFDPSGEYPDKTFGFPEGSSDSGKVVKGGENGDWGGSMQRALAFAKVANEFVGRDIVSSQKRTRQTTANGSISDHYDQQQDSYAVDLACSGSEGDRILEELMKWVGFPEYKGGYWLNFIKDGYRYQVGWKVPQHFDHIHIGVKKAPGQQDTSGIISSTSKTSTGGGLPPAIKKILSTRDKSGSSKEEDDEEDGPKKTTKEDREKAFQQDLSKYQEYLDAIQAKKSQ
jgi:hypothetical protein